MISNTVRCIAMFRMKQRIANVYTKVKVMRQQFQSAFRLLCSILGGKCRKKQFWFLTFFKLYTSRLFKKEVDWNKINGKHFESKKVDAIRRKKGTINTPPNNSSNKVRKGFEYTNWISLQTLLSTSPTSALFMGVLRLDEPSRGGGLGGPR